MNSYKTFGTCSSSIDFEISNGKLVYVKFNGGCKGNTQAVERLCLNKDIDDIIKLLAGINCRNGTSCPDQLAKALINFKNKNI